MLLEMAIIELTWYSWWI